MQLFYCFKEEQQIKLDSKEAHHCLKVLRKQKGDIINAVDGKGNFYKAKLSSNNIDQCYLDIIDIQSNFLVWPYYIHIAIVPPKNHQRLDWFIEKSVEVGVNEISIISSQRLERKTIKLDRLNKIAISAMKQSYKTIQPIINNIVSYETFIHSIKDYDKFICFLDTEHPIHLAKLVQPKQKSCILIGPEGDFTNNEIQQARDLGFIPASLGAYRLRTETAALYACQAVHVANEIKL